MVFFGKILVWGIGYFVALFELSKITHSYDSQPALMIFNFAV